MKEREIERDNKNENVQKDKFNRQICRLLFNFTLIENKVLQYKLDKFEREFQFDVANIHVIYYQSQ